MTGWIIGFGIIFFISTILLSRANTDHVKHINQLQNELSRLTTEHNTAIMRIGELEKAIREKDILFEALQKRDNESISKVTSLYADYLLIQYDISARYLRTKPHPAHGEAQRIGELKQKTKTHIEQFRQMMYKYEMLLQLFPELSVYVDDFETIKQLEDVSEIEKLQEEFDRTRYFLSKEEYEKLDIDERNQLALDRYIKGQKTKWQIGRDYELFCGWQYERSGWQVDYTGIEKRITDLGRDLIVSKDKIIHVVQCKYWSQGKQIHEKHITQLFGTTFEYRMDKDDSLKIIPVLITNISLSETAKKFADKLGVKIVENALMGEFPRIKCNINRDAYGSETRIYHLPFDQQYDRTKINKAGEFFAYTVKEAAAKGFRRAYRYYGG